MLWTQSSLWTSSWVRRSKGWKTGERSRQQTVETHLRTSCLEVKGGLSTQRAFCLLRDGGRRRRRRRESRERESGVIMGCNMCVVKRPEEQYRIMFQVRNQIQVFPEASVISVYKPVWVWWLRYPDGPESTNTWRKSSRDLWGLTLTPSTHTELFHHSSSFHLHQMFWEKMFLMSMIKTESSRERETWSRTTTTTAFVSERDEGGGKTVSRCVCVCVCVGVCVCVCRCVCVRYSSVSYGTIHHSRLV